MADTLVLLRLEHRNFIRVLDVLEYLVDRRVHDGYVDDQLLEQVFAYFLGYPHCCHHPKEDLVYRRLRERDPSLADRVGDLLAQHDRLAELTQATANRVRRSRQQPDPDLVDALQEFVDVTRRHIEIEEREIFPAMESILTQEDWDEIDFAMFDQTDPVFDLDRERRFRELRNAILDRADRTPPPHADEAEG